MMTGRGELQPVDPRGARSADNEQVMDARRKSSQCALKHSPTFTSGKDDPTYYRTIEPVGTHLERRAALRGSTDVDVAESFRSKINAVVLNPGAGIIEQELPSFEPIGRV